MRLTTTKVGPLVAPAANNVSVVQRYYGTTTYLNALVLDGTLTTG